jgi:hypothetical protein
VAHALLQAHAELMAGAGSALDARGRRPWEGYSRSDVRSARNAARKLPFHLGRERGWAALMHLVDPRVPIDSALDAAREGEHGVGPRRLSTLCSMRMQASLLGWLEACQAALASEAAQRARREERAQRSPPGAGVITVVGSPGKPGRRGWAGLGGLGGGGAAPAPLPPAAGDPPREPPAEELASPFALQAAAAARAPARSAPATPSARTLAAAAAAAAAPGAATLPAVPPLAAQRVDSLHAYVGMLSIRPAEPQDLGAIARGLGASASQPVDIPGDVHRGPAAGGAARQQQRRSTVDGATLARQHSYPVFNREPGMLRVSSSEALHSLQARSPALHALPLQALAFAFARVHPSPPPPDGLAGAAATRGDKPPSPYAQARPSRCTLLRPPCCTQLCVSSQSMLPRGGMLTPRRLPPELL